MRIVDEKQIITSFRYKCGRKEGGSIFYTLRLSLLSRSMWLTKSRRVKTNNLEKKIYIVMLKKIKK